MLKLKIALRSLRRYFLAEDKILTEEVEQKSERVVGSGAYRSGRLVETMLKSVVSDEWPARRFFAVTGRIAVVSMMLVAFFDFIAFIMTHSCQCGVQTELYRGKRDHWIVCRAFDPIFSLAVTYALTWLGCIVNRLKCNRWLVILMVGTGIIIGTAAATVNVGALMLLAFLPMILLMVIGVVMATYGWRQFDLAAIYRLHWLPMLGIFTAYLILGLIQGFALSAVFIFFNSVMWLSYGRAFISDAVHHAMSNKD